MGASDVQRISVPEFRRQQHRRALRPYEALDPADEWAPSTAATADQVLHEGWSFQRFPAVRLEPPVAWEEACSESRSWNFHLHCLDGLAPVLCAFDHTGDERYLDFAAAVAVDWARAHPSIDTEHGFAWYDMAIGLRAYRLGYVLDAVVRRPRYSDEQVRALLDSVMLHALALTDDGLFADHSNHGFYQAAGQLALANRFPTLPGMSVAEGQALGRVEALVQRQFTTEGVHREHSPDYHWMVLAAFTGLITSGLITDEKSLELHDKIEAALAWLVMPNAHLVMFGDTPHRDMTQEAHTHIRNDHLRFALSGGRLGQPPAAASRVFPESGYLVIRDRWPSGPEDFPDCSYLAFNCAFHSQTHKHADDLSLVWYDHGSELLVDAGRYGYEGRVAPGSRLWEQGFWYSEPNRLYVESTRAHNTVEIDGLSYPRRVTPYGSALERWGEVDGVHYGEAEVRQFQTIRHARVLVFTPGSWLVVIDWLWDNVKEPHTFTQRFHFAPELDLHGDGHVLRASLPNGAPPLHAVPLLSRGVGVELARGRRRPRLGWIARQDREMTPCWSAAYQVAGTPHHTFATLLAFGDRPVPDPRLTRVSRSGRKAQLRWSQAGEETTVSVSRPLGGPFELRVDRS